MKYTAEPDMNPQHKLLLGLLFYADTVEATKP